ncbi:flagella basal body P-ring formation protein FlgA [uncultured Gammaproteobacteria bacterium]
MITTKTLFALGTLLLLTATAPLAASAAAQTAIVQTPAAQTAAAIDTGEIRDLVSERLTRQLPMGRMQIEIDLRTLDVALPAGRITVLGLENFVFHSVYGRFTTDLIVATVTDASRRLTIAGRAWSMIEVPTLARRLNPGEVISGGDLAWVEVRADYAEAEIAMAPSDLVGRTTRRLLPANTPVRLHDLQLPRMIAKNAVVTLMLQTRTMTLTTQGRALQDGGKGEVIRVLNTQSNRTVDAVISGPNLVLINTSSSLSN